MGEITFYKVIRMNKGDRMLRIGFGQNGGRWFIRLDLWWYGLRLNTI